jgi:hypothetical protein
VERGTPDPFRSPAIYYDGARRRTKISMVMPNTEICEGRLVWLVLRKGFCETTTTAASRAERTHRNEI